MKKKVSVTLPSDVLAKIDQLVGSKCSRSAFIEHVLRTYLSGREREKVQARDLERINAAPDRLNLEAEDVTSFQA
jgi:metal-responsive CopG/Arc/MetJ family transcriptional regulator